MLLASAAVLLTGCSIQFAHPGSGSGDAVQPRASAPDFSMPPPPPPKPSVMLVGDNNAVPWRGPVRLQAQNGKIMSVRVYDKAGDTASGKINRTGSRWQSSGVLYPSTLYHARVRMAGVSGHTVRRIWFKTKAPTKVLSMYTTTTPDATFGIGEPIVVNFSTPVADRAAVQKRMTVTTSAGGVVGAWHWFSPTVVHYRPKTYWPANTTVSVKIDLSHLYAGNGVWGDRLHEWSFHIGNAYIAYVNGVKKTFRWTENGKTIANWPTAIGMPNYQTRWGTYIALEKSPLVEMKSCSVGLSCTPGTPGFYDLKVKYDVRLTYSGTFVHAAPWDPTIGVRNTSHGCIHLRTVDAKRYMDTTQIGDIVVVTGSNRPPNPDDPGMMDWNLSWSQWLAGSALS